MRTTAIACTMALFALRTASANEPSAVERGKQIATTADQRDTGFSDYQASLRMVLKDRHGQRSERSVRTRVLEVKDDGDKLLVVFDQPSDIKGTALLTFTHKNSSDDQWLYLPALERVKRIASNNQAGPFMGSEFAYEDLASQEVEKYTYRLLGEEKLANVAAFKVERRPVNTRSGYLRQIVWYDREHFRVIKIDFYDRKDTLLKTLSYVDYKQYLSKHWRASRMEMVNHQTGKSTTLEWSGYKFRTGLGINDFDPQALKRPG
jgi:outer membrane lipoprotein-sorting protein